MLTFRVDNPHTKPTIFWEWLIDEVHQVNPNVIFLSEAFTRPKVMKSLAKAGFAQSYTYFTWRHTKQELTDYFTELTQTDAAEYAREHLPEYARYQHVLPPSPRDVPASNCAGTLSSVYGIYSSYELREATPVAGKEEYLNSEKYEYKVWDWDRPGNISQDIANVNAIRRVHPALHEYDNLRFFWAESGQMLCYGKSTPDHSDNILIVVNLDPHNAQGRRIWFLLEAFGLQHAAQFEARGTDHRPDLDLVGRRPLGAAQSRGGIGPHHPPWPTDRCSKLQINRTGRDPPAVVDDRRSVSARMRGAVTPHAQPG